MIVITVLVVKAPAGMSTLAAPSLVASVPPALPMFAEAMLGGAPLSELTPELPPEVLPVPAAPPLDELDPAPEPPPEEDEREPPPPEEEEVLSVLPPSDGPTPPFEPEQAESAAIAAVRAPITQDFLSLGEALEELGSHRPYHRKGPRPMTEEALEAAHRRAWDCIDAYRGARSRG